MCTLTHHYPPPAYKRRDFQSESPSSSPAVAWCSSSSPSDMPKVIVTAGTCFTAYHNLIADLISRQCIHKWWTAVTQIKLVREYQACTGTVTTSDKPCVSRSVFFKVCAPTLDRSQETMSDSYRAVIGYHIFNQLASSKLSE